MLNIKNKTKKGFTLLEILLVVGIISVLAGIVIVAINPGRQLAIVRNTQRKQNISEINKALSQYYIDNNHYPATIVTTLTEICDTGSLTFEDNPDCGSFVDLSILVPTYLTAIPTDPVGNVISTIFIKKAFASLSGSGYKVALNSSNNIYLEAPNAELFNIISLGSNMGIVDPFADWTIGLGGLLWSSGITANFNVSDETNRENWEGASLVCDNLGARLPTREELYAAFEDQFSGGIGYGFLDSLEYWSSTEYNDLNSWLVSFGDGYMYERYYVKSILQAYLCVH